ncbi:MAG: ABC transporter substrate-binding protein [Bdellovibrionales bacterium]
MKVLHVCFLSAFLLIGTAAPVYAATSKEAASATQNAADKETTTLIESFYATLLETMKQGETLGFEGRYNKLSPVIEKTFNLPLMTRYAVGPSWSKATKAQQESLIKAFTEFSVATYASRFTKYDGEAFLVTGAKPMNARAFMVQTTLTPQGEEAIALNYLLRPDQQKKWRIADVYLDATISELATRRADFGAVIKQGGLDKLVTSLQDKVAKMKNPETSDK